MSRKSAKQLPGYPYSLGTPTTSDNKTIILLRADEVRRRLGNPPNSTFYRMIDEGIIPPAIHIKGGRNAFWVESEIENVIHKILAEAGREVLA